MLIRSRIRGPKLTLKLLFLGLGLLIVPWLSYYQLVEMETLLVQGQQNAQLLMARGIAALFNNRDDIFRDLPIHQDEFEPVYASPLIGSVRIDGSTSDWRTKTPLITNRYEASGDDGSFFIAIGEQVNQIYVSMEISDDRHVYRDPTRLRLDRADHVRLKLAIGEETAAGISLTFSQPGVVTAYRMNEAWTFARTTAPVTDILGYVRATATGYAIEFKLPLSLFGEKQGFEISFVDVDDPATRQIREVTSTVSPDVEQPLNLIVFRTKETMDLIEGLGFVDARVLVYDEQKRIRGEAGRREFEQAGGSDDWFSWTLGFERLRPLLHRLVIGEEWTDFSSQNSKERASESLEYALDGNPTAIQQRSADGSQLIMATYPIRSGDAVLGAVSVELGIKQILSFQRTALRQIALVSSVALLVVLLLAAGFAVRLAYRIRKLRRETSAAIDDFGRLQSDSLVAEVVAGDEIGDLARSIDNMLGRLREHHTFLERMPRTLRHEINNPLNNLSTSLENLKTATTDEQRTRYLESASRGLMRIGGIVQNLADAASLEDSLTNEEKRVLDINALLRNYVSNINLTEKAELQYRAPADVVDALISDSHIEQMMDKLVDNALDFHRPNSPIRVQLDASDEFVRIGVANRGPTLASDPDLLFERLFSRRLRQSKLHFGLGLYVVRVIAEYHGGNVQAKDLSDGSGVIFVIEFPRALPRVVKETELEVAA